MKFKSILSLFIFSLALHGTYSEDESNPFLDMASSFLQETLANQNGGSGGIGGIAQVIGSLMQGDSGKAGSGGDNGAAQLLSGLGSLLASATSGNNNNQGGGGGFDPSMIMNVVGMFANMNQGNARNKRSNSDGGAGGMDALMSIASTVMQNLNSGNDDDDDSPRQAKKQDSGDALTNMLPLVMQMLNSFTGPDMEKTENRHKDHASVLPPFLEHIHVMWDQFQQSDLAQALFMKLGLNNVFKGFVNRDGKMDYDRLFNSLENQSFRRRWIKQALMYMADWANFLSNPEVYQRYIATGQIMANGFLKANGYPDSAQLDISRPSETISKVIDHTARKQLNVKISSISYVKPAVNYIRELLKLGKARELLQKFNATELSDKLADTLNLEVIEPVLKVHRAYRFAVEQPECDRYVLCEVNSHDPNEELGLGGFKHGVTRFGSMAAAWFISSETGTPFWTLFATINDPYKCQKKFPIDCTGFHDGEARVTTEYIHNEL
ncbi:uncharacterized protein LOC134835289 [Culicoides brevitarsis]|uniref:uncharacterized protein LOC134835289 n=1 Tax=Culicoides brevitarsis TaxID=469753 RepID=UPI00307BB77F